VQFHAILIDFGKACSFANAKRTELSEELKAEYREKHAHIAPEIIEGKSKQSPARDVYALGIVVLNYGLGSFVSVNRLSCYKSNHVSTICLRDVRLNIHHSHRRMRVKY
jgi:serine/threonine protein kinase